jgi:hypothetical protein
MKRQRVVLNWRNVDPVTNKRRWYHLHTSLDLWNRPIVICRWGRIDRQQDEQIYWYQGQEELRRIIRAKLIIRKLHGYRIVKPL